ncbi:hypothetical protein [Candidatus Pantoea multigeneris]|uniref:Lipoprotein n=1 Tax=Candidatus Pantoea multigeneris TaxID=2608357 RepID=A0ABX0RDQ5_9GAMM|nr:hypothetical protein [Pantoea multigeneris]NIF22879.1 hypothetical protein [Pantoea multigeneris]
MLNSLQRISVKIKTDEYLGVTEYAYTCFGDSEDKNTWYVVPEIPVFESQDGKPKFMFYKYRGEDQEGGYAMFSVILPQPNSELQGQIKTELIGSDLRLQLTAKSKLIVKYAQATEAYVANPNDPEKKKDKDLALKNTGLSESQASEFLNKYDKTKGDDQFLSDLMPASAQAIKLVLPSYTSAKATLILDDNEAFYREIPTEQLPSGLGDNNTVFSVSLTKAGAELFEKVLKGSEEGPSVGVRFDFNLNALLPAAKVTVKFDSEITKSLVLETSHHTWSANEKEITQKFSEKEAFKVLTDITLTQTDLGMTSEQYNKWVENLNNWGQSQIEQILSSQTGLDIGLNLLNDAGEYRQFTETLNQLKSFERVYEQNSAVSFSIYPQTPLPSILSIVGEEKVDEYFKAYTLDDPFFTDFQPTFIVPKDLEKYRISNVIVNVKYNGDVDTLIFNKDKPSEQQTKKWYLEEKIGRTFSYNYEVTFTGGGAEYYQSDEIEVADKLVIALDIEDHSGLVYAEIVPVIQAQEWNLFRQIKVLAQFSDSANNIPVFKEERIINKDNSPNPIMFAVGKDYSTPLYYKLEYSLTNGDVLNGTPDTGETNPQLPGYNGIRSQSIQVENALPYVQDYTYIITPTSGKEVSQLVLKVTVEDTTNNLTQAKQFILKDFDGDAKSDTITFHLAGSPSKINIKASYHATIVYRGASPETIKNDIENELIIFEV